MYSWIRVPSTLLIVLPSPPPVHLDSTNWLLQVQIQLSRPICQLLSATGRIKLGRTKILYPAFSMASFSGTVDSGSPAALYTGGGAGLTSCHSTESTRNRILSPGSRYSRSVCQLSAFRRDTASWPSVTVFIISCGLNIRSSSCKTQKYFFSTGSLPVSYTQSNEQRSLQYWIGG
jgi:hypothetical protein